MPTGERRQGGQYSHYSENVGPINRCTLARQMHIYDLHYALGTGIYTRKCVNCGLTEAEAKMLLIDGSPGGSDG